MQGEYADYCCRYNNTYYTDPWLKALIQYIHHSHLHMLSMCKIMQSAAKSLVHYDRLCDDNDFSVIAVCLKQYI